MTSGGLEPVSDGGQGGHSIFATHFIGALKSNGSVLEGSELFSTVRRTVTASSRQVPESGPTRSSGHEGAISSSCAILEIALSAFVRD